MSADTRANLDPRIRRTRLLLQKALEKLLKEKSFDQISVQDIATEATVNRVTFYDHYPDKFALLECTVGSRFEELLTQRAVQFDGTCSSALSAVVLGVCDYLSEPGGLGQTEPHVESAVIAVVRRMILDGLRRTQPQGTVSPEMLATTLSWAIYGAAHEWARTPDRSPSEEIMGTIVSLIAPILEPLHNNPPAQLPAIGS